MWINILPIDVGAGQRFEPSALRLRVIITHHVFVCGNFPIIMKIMIVICNTKYSIRFHF